MKVWFKLFIGAVLGAVLGYLLPADGAAVTTILPWLEKLAIRIGRYAVIPMVVFSLTIAVYELRQDGQFWFLTFRTFVMLLLSGVFVIGAGIAATLIFPPARIPILVEEQVQTVSLDVSESVLEIFPSNMFAVFGGDGAFLLPLYIFAFFLGMGLSYDKAYSKQVISLIDSLSRIFYHIGVFFSEILGLVIIILAAYWCVRFHAVLRADVFRDLIILLGIFSVILGFIVLPLLLYCIKPKCKPWAVLYGSLGQALASFFSGDINFSLPVIVRHLKENLGVRRRSNAVTVSFFTIFGRAGSAMVAAAAFIVIIKSYSSLDIETKDIIAIGARALLISFLLARHPGDGAYTALAVLCLGYGKGFEAGYLILKPLAFYLIAVGTFLDVMIATFGSYALARTGGFQADEKNPRRFI